MNDRAVPSVAVPGTAQRTVRRLIVFTLLAVLVTITAVGVAGLLERVLDVTAPLAGTDVAGLALSLAFTLVGGPLAAVLWWSVWRRMTDESERSSLAWGLYLTAMYTVALIVAASALLGAAGGLVVGRWLPAEFAAGITWALVWAWNRWMLRHRRRSPARLATVPIVIGGVYGLVLALVGAVGAIGAVLDAAIRGVGVVTLAGAPWWQVPLDASCSLIVGGAIWYLHWFRDGARHVATVFADVVLVVVGVTFTAVVMIGGAGAVVFVAMRLLFDPSEPADLVLEPLGTAIAAAAVGALAWVYHRPVVMARSERTRGAQRLVMSAIGLVATATGIGVILNAALAALVSPIAASATRVLLLGGLSALVVGGPTWWVSWRPTRSAEPDEAADPGRRVYLVVVFGVSAIVAIVALLVVGYRLFEFALDPTTVGSLVDRVRAPLGLLVATALVFGYHFAVWRRDRDAIAANGPAPGRRIGRIILVVSGDRSALQQPLARATGARITVWHRAGAAPGPGPDAAALVTALDGVAARRVLVVTGHGDRIDVVPLADEA
ncbi:DUF5671 domain-containing protein [Agromyces sp. H3Y2-19a]|uniref:DUF5671 domain-containing protein n=1 Tax=Agromyces chromiiresistens TaxID=3030835 RepID=UPI0023B9CA80|nr:DUF5671 domain-containing protein [Agromyces chromiiresistens]MDF0515622.1 DUF5671 domain-containing protein [Agromyces chromiiresistens]